MSTRDQDDVHVNPHHFWRWAYSDYLSNANRGVLAEYLVGCAIGCDMTRPRREWDVCDLVTPDGVRVEVKATGRVQSWQNAAPSRIVFDIKRTRGWSHDDGTTEPEPVRSADVYVFCMHEEENRAIANPLDRSQWRFLPASRRLLDEALGDQKSAALSTLARIAQRAPVPHHKLREAFEQAARS